MKKSKVKKNINSYLKNALENINYYLKNNLYFLSFVLINVINSGLLRAFTSGKVKNFFLIQPILGDFFIIIFVGSFCYLFKHFGRQVYLGVLTFIFTAICLVNSSYYTFYSSFGSFSLLSTTKYLKQVEDAVFDAVLKPKDFVYLILPLCGLYIYYRLNQKKYFKDNLRTSVNKKTFLEVGLFSVYFLIIFLLTLTPTDYSRFVKQWNREYVVNKFGVYIYQLNDLVKSVEPKVVSIFGYDQARKNFNEFTKDLPNKQTYKNKYTNIYKGKNVIFIHGESIQNFVIGLKINGQEVTPNLNKIVKESMYFDNFYPQVSVGTSSDTEFTLNTSLMPAQVGIAFVSYFNREYITIPKKLKELGYYNLAFHANAASYWNRNVMYKAIGYDKFYAKKNYEIDEIIGLGLADHSFFNQTTKLLKEESLKHDKFLATVIMLSNHTPFYEVKEYAPFDVDLKVEEVNENNEKVVNSYPYMNDTRLGRYLKSVHYSDKALGDFFSQLNKEGLLENTVIVFYGDHDARLPMADYQRFYNYDYKTNSVLDKNDPNYKEFGKYQYELNRKVPFFIWEKSKKYVQKNSNVMGMYDVMPTIGNMFGFYNKYALGHDIFEIGDKNVVLFPDGSWITNNMYYDFQKSEQFMIKEAILKDDYITENNNYLAKVLKVSNDILLYNLLKEPDKAPDKANEYNVIKEVSK